jgi:hypothetical protein
MGTATGARRLVGKRRAQQPHPTGGQHRLGLGIPIAFVHDQQLPWPLGQQRRLDVEDAHQHLALVGFGVGQRERDWQAVHGTDQGSRRPQK